MPSPFPGMDPYLENPGDWPDFHARFIIYLGDAIGERVPDHYDVRIGERLRVVGPADTEAETFMPDVAVARGSGSPGRPTLQGTATLEPVTVPHAPLEVEERPDRFIEIYKRPGRSLITVVELLSPSNKSGSDRRDYLTKRSVLLYQNVHLVELDLLIQGRRVPMGGPLPPADYYAVVSRSDAWPDSQVYAWTLRQPLPTLPVPLSDPDPDVWVDLAQVFATTYERARYDRSLAYHQAPLVPLSDEDLAWATERARAARPGR
jgi:hypothetical protein